MSIRHLRNSRVSSVLLISWIFISYFPGFILSAVVSLSSIEIFKTHEWLRVTPTIYFQCKAEDKIVLPDIKKAHVLYTFKGEESWQPLANFSSTKCKRCGIYEENSIISDEVFEEWEFCPSDFTTPHGRYVRFKEKKFNATFLCPECLSFFNVSSSGSDGHEHDSGKEKQVAVLVLLSSVVSIVLIIGVVGAYKYCQRKKREREQARFVKLFAYGDDIEDELDLGTTL